MLNDTIFDSRSVYDYLESLQQNDFSLVLYPFLESFRDPKLLNFENFIDGVYKFIQMANTPLDINNAKNRRLYFGHEHAGLFYNTDLACLLNQISKNNIRGLDVIKIAPKPWESVVQHGFLTLIYKGDKPASALNQLLKGPTVIDCAMFNELAIWFGIRNILGDVEFDKYFGKTPFYITQIFFESIPSINKPFERNPLASFFDFDCRAYNNINSLAVTYIPNISLYQFKHPGGTANGDTCLVINGKYNIFNPKDTRNTDLSRQEIVEMLIEEFNQPQDVYDIERLQQFRAAPNLLHPNLHYTYEKLVEIAEGLENKTLDVENVGFINHFPIELSGLFNLMKFQSWKDKIDNNESSLYSFVYSEKSIDPFLLAPRLNPFRKNNPVLFKDLHQRILKLKNSYLCKTDKNDLVENSRVKKLQKSLDSCLLFCNRVQRLQPSIFNLVDVMTSDKDDLIVATLKELVVNGKNIVFLSDDVFKNCHIKFENRLAVYNFFNEKIDYFLTTEKDVVFLDCRQLPDLINKIFFNKIYLWFCSNTDKSLFIVSNSYLNFAEFYGYDEVNHYFFPPLINYDSPHYLNFFNEKHKKSDTGSFRFFKERTRTTEDFKNDPKNYSVENEAGFENKGI